MAGLSLNLSGHFMKMSRSFSSVVTAKKLVFSEFGDPVKVVKLETESLDSPSGRNVLVSMMVASMNPADVNTVQGTYPVKPNLPGVPGFEGVGKVEAVGDNVTTLKPGDHVIPDADALGTWRSHLITSEQSLLKVPDSVPVVELCGLSSNSSTAYRMLRDFVSLQAGDVVIQNGANSAAGQNVIQLCRAWGIKSVNIVRDRPEVDKLKDSLTQIGATHVLTEQELRSTDMFKTGACAAPKLALNCVGGKSSTEVMRKLAHGGIMVTYGGMSREPVTIPTALFIFKRVKAEGFWMTGWTREHRGSAERAAMFDELMDLMKKGELKAPAHSLVPLDSYNTALQQMTSAKGFSNTKFILDFRH